MNMTKEKTEIKEPREEKVWDPLVRIFHWSLVAAFAVSIVTRGKPEWLHVGSGYFIGALIVVRVLWGFVGTRHARFADFVRGPVEILRHLRDVVLLRPKAYLGHDPAGGAMIIAILLTLSLTVFFGLMLYGVEKKAGPFAGWKIASEGGLESFVPSVHAHREESEDVRENEEHGDRGRTASGSPGGEAGYGAPVKGGAGKGEKAEWIEELHELLAFSTLGLVILHVLGVLVVSLATRENLVKGMITGRKKAVPEES